MSSCKECKTRDEIIRLFVIRVKRLEKDFEKIVNAQNKGELIK